MRLFVFIATLLLCGVSVSAAAQERPYEVRLIGVGEDLLVQVPTYRAPEYDINTHHLVYVVSSLGMPEADLPFTFTPEGVVVSREDMPRLRETVLSQGGRMLFVCTVPEEERAAFNFAEKTSRNAFCTLNQG